MNNNNNGKKVLLPPGFKFEPTDEEVVFEYLKCKVFCLPPPPYSLISEVDPYLLYHSHPSNLLFPSPQGMNNEDQEEQEGYFFCKMRSEYGSCNYNNSWNWKVGGDDEQILPSGRAGDMNNNMIGMKRTLVLHRGNNAMTPHWVMHEYRLLPAAATNYYTYHHQFNTQLLHQNEWVLCHVFQKQSSSRMDHQQALSMQYRRQNYNDDDDDDNDNDSEDYLSSSSSPPTSRCSSAVTDEDDEEEEEEVVSRW